MKKNNETLTYGQLYRKLKELGYQRHVAELNGKKVQVFEYEEIAGSMIVLPERDAAAVVEPHYVQQALVVLRSCGLLPETNPLLT